MKAIFIFSSIFAIALLFSCDKVTEDLEADLGFDYFPLEVGKQWVYQVDSIIFDTTGMGIIVDSSRHLVKEEIVSLLQDNQGMDLYRIERSIRKDPGQPWQVTDVWAAQRNMEAAYKIEDNLRFVKMVFPLKENLIWDGNRFFDASLNIVIAGETIEMFKNWEYEVIRMDEPEQIGQFAFDKVSTISQADNENLIELRFSREKYAKGVGLVYKEQWILDTQNITDNIPWEEKAQKGFILRQLLLEY